MMLPLRVGGEIDRDQMLLKLIDIHYDRNDFELARGKFRVRGDVVECWPAYGIRVRLAEGGLAARVIRRLEG